MGGTIRENTELLKEMIEYCIESGYDPVLISTPLSEELNKKFSKEFVDKALYENIDAANVYNIPYLDYRTSPLFQNNPDMFWNGVDWLSVDGRRTFMDILNRDYLQKCTFSDIGIRDCPGC